MSTTDFLGARFSADGMQINFRVNAPKATRLDVWLYARPTNAAPILTLQLTVRDDGIFAGSVPRSALNAAGAQIWYGLRAWGPNWPYAANWVAGSSAGFITDVDTQGNRFNPNKLLLDPYALEVSHSPLTPEHPVPDGYLSGADHRNDDSGPFAPKGAVLALPSPDFGAKPVRPFKDEIIYEVHLRGLTENDQSIPEALRGTYAGAALRAADLAALGVTAVEFMPIHETQSGLNDDVAFHQQQNYWGYDSVNFFAPSRRYASDQSPGGPTREWIAMVRAFHAVGLKVYVDVVYNHFNEGKVDGGTGTAGKIFSLRGLDNAGYYEIFGPGQANMYQDNNGVGPNINAATEITRNLVLDSLKYWTNTMGADGFRFDLGAVLGNELSMGGYQFGRDDPANILNRAVSELPARPLAGGPGVDLTCEPYTADGNPAGQQQGNMPVGWSEWNDRYRDVWRASQNKLGYRDVTPGAMATRIAGSDDLFRARGRKPWNGVNYICCHDGFTMADLYSFNEKHNDLPFPKGPSAGGRSSEDEMCWDHGGDPMAQREAVRTGLAVLLLSAGVPMIAAGSEFFRTQFGNNNAFNLDTDANWLDPSQAVTESALFNFTKQLLHFRNAHPSLRPAEFFTGTDHNGNGRKDLTWLRNDGGEVDGPYFNNPQNHFLAWMLDGTEFGDSASAIYIAYNGWIQTVNAVLPPNQNGKRWLEVANTSVAALSWGNIRPPGSEVVFGFPDIDVPARSLVLLIEG